MKKIYKYLAFLIIVLFIFSCGSGKLSNLDRKPNEAIIIAKMKIKDMNENISSTATILFDETNWGKHVIKIDNSAYIYLRLPVGKHYFAGLSEHNSSQNLPENLITFELPESRIYYIGDIYMLCQIDFNYGTFLGVAGALAYELRDAEAPHIYVEDNYEEAKAYFTKLFPTDEMIYKSIANFDSTFKIADIESFKKESIFVPKPDSTTKSYQRRKMK